MQAPAQEQGQNLEMSLREHLLAAGASGSGPQPYPSTSAAPLPADAQYPPSDSASPHEQYDQGAQQSYGMSGDSAGDDGLSPDARKGKRELSTSKRAAQNRAAQRAFRQRKEGYIKKLEEQVKDHATLESNFRTLQGENYQLREYILNLQSRLLENSADFPPAPSHVNLSTAGSARTEAAAPPAAMGDHQVRQVEPLRRDGMSQLQAAAAQASEVAQPGEGVYGLGSKRARVEGGGDVKAGS